MSQRLRAANWIVLLEQHFLNLSKTFLTEKWRKNLRGRHQQLPLVFIETPEPVNILQGLQHTSRDNLNLTDQKTGESQNPRVEGLPSAQKPQTSPLMPTTRSTL